LLDSIVDATAPQDRPPSGPRPARARPADGEAAAAGRPTPLDQLERLSALRREGALTDAEFEAQKQAILMG
jgi:hypothetical protein